MNIDVGPVAADSAQIVCLIGVEVDKAEGIEGRRHLQGARRAALDGIAGGFRNVNAGTAEAVDIISLEIGKIREGPGIGRAVFSTISSLSSDHCPFHRIRREDQSRADPGLKGHGGGWLYDRKLIPLFALQKTAAGFRRSAAPTA